MGVTCVAYNCKNRYRPGLTFHSFPLKNKPLLDKWIRAIKRDKWTPNSSSRICSEHFEPECYEQNGWTTKKALKEDAVPSIFSFPEHLQKKSKPRAPPRKRKLTLPVEDASEELSGSTINTSNQHFPSDVSNSQDSTVSEATEQKKKKKREHYVGDFNVSTENLPPSAVKCIEKCKEVIADKNTRIKILKQSNRRLLKKIRSLETLVVHLQNEQLASEEVLTTILVHT